jgi:hypothetical protein
LRSQASVIRHALSGDGGGFALARRVRRGHPRPHQLEQLLIAERLLRSSTYLPR